MGCPTSYRPGSTTRPRSSTDRCRSWARCRRSKRHRHEDGVRIRWVDDDVAICVESVDRCGRVGPCRAAVGRLVNARPIDKGSVVADVAHRGINSIGIVGIDGDLRSGEPVEHTAVGLESPGAAGVGRYEDADAVVRIRRVVGLAGARVNHLVITGSDGDGAHRERLLRVSQLVPVRSAVGRLPDAAPGRRDINGIRVRRVGGDAGDPAADGIGARDLPGRDRRGTEGLPRRRAQREIVRKQRSILERQAQAVDRKRAAAPLPRVHPGRSMWCTETAKKKLKLNHSCALGRRSARVDCRHPCRTT